MEFTAVLEQFLLTKTAKLMTGHFGSVILMQNSLERKYVQHRMPEESAAFSVLVLLHTGTIRLAIFV